MSEISKGAIIQFYASEQSSSLLYLFYSLLLLWQGQITVRNDLLSTKGQRENLGKYFFQNADPTLKSPFYQCFALLLFCTSTLGLRGCKPSKSRRRIK